MIPFRRVRTGDRQLDNVQDNVEASLRPLLGNPLLDGALLTGAEIPSGSAAHISHRLGRTPRGWFLVSPGRDVRVWEAREPTGLYLYLQASTAITGSVWVF